MAMPWCLEALCRTSVAPADPMFAPPPPPPLSFIHVFLVVQGPWCQSYAPIAKLLYCINHKFVLFVIKAPRPQCAGVLSRSHKCCMNQACPACVAFIAAVDFWWVAILLSRRVLLLLLQALMLYVGAFRYPVWALSLLFVALCCWELCATA